MYGHPYLEEPGPGVGLCNKRVKWTLDLCSELLLGFWTDSVDSDSRGEDGGSGVSEREGADDTNWLRRWLGMEEPRVLVSTPLNTTADVTLAWRHTQLIAPSVASLSISAAFSPPPIRSVPDRLHSSRAGEERCALIVFHDPDHITRKWVLFYNPLGIHPILRAGSFGPSKEPSGGTPSASDEARDHDVEPWGPPTTPMQHQSMSTHTAARIPQRSDGIDTWSRGCHPHTFFSHV